MRLILNLWFSGCMLFMPFIHSPSLSFILSGCVTVIVISLVIDHSSGSAPTILQLLETWLWKDSINFHLREHACFQWDTEHLCRPEEDNISFRKATELSLPASWHDSGTRCQVMMTGTQTAIHLLKIFKYYYSFSTKYACMFKFLI